MITCLHQAERVQQKRRAFGKKGRAKAVRRWFKRQTGIPSIDAGQSMNLIMDHEKLAGNFDGCRSWDELTEEEKELRYHMTKLQLTNKKVSLQCHTIN